MMILPTDNARLFNKQSKAPQQETNPCEAPHSSTEGPAEPPLKPYDYFLAQSEIILKGVGFHCIPFSKDHLFLQKEAYVWHTLVKELVNDRGHSLRFLAATMRIEKKVLELLYTRPYLHIKLDNKVKHTILFLHQQ